MAELTEKAIQQIVSLARQGVAVQQIPMNGTIPFAVIPEGHKLQSLVELIYNEHNTAPERVKANVTVLDPASFIEYYTLFSDPNSRVFADETTLRVLAVLDYHGAGEGGPRWGSHRVTLALRQSEEWKVWLSGNNKQMAQQTFAEFLEQNSMDIVKPSPADMLAVARDLEATTEVEFGSGIRMSDGQMRFKYTETTKATVGAGTLAVPEQFVLNIPAFIGGERVPMQALLRFRVREGKLVIWYTLVRPEEVIRTAFIAARDAIADSLKLTIVNGSPA